MDESAAMSRWNLVGGLIDRGTGTSDKLDTAIMEEHATIVHFKQAMVLIDHSTWDVNAIFDAG